MKQAGPLQIPEQASPATPDAGWGFVYFKSDGLPYAKNDAGTEFLLTPSADTIPHTDGATAVGAGGTTTSTTYVNLPVRLRVVNFVKYRADTKLLVRLSGGECSHSNSLATINIGIDIGGTDYNICTTIGGGTFHSGELVIAGIAAGTIANIEVQWKTSAATASMTNTSIWALTVTETF